jgi:solute carrier family 39 (zinc transporter), member 1/2/3
VAGDSFFLTLFAVIVFHQMFEGIALGTRIAALGLDRPTLLPIQSHGSGHRNKVVKSGDGTAGCNPATEASISENPQVAGTEPPVSTVSMTKKISLAAAFALVTPTGMAIGISVLHRFNGNDPSTLIAIGTLDALSAGILLWVGVVEMWAEDWMFGGELTTATPLNTVLGLLSLLMGMIVMSLLGKWA